MNPPDRLPPDDPATDLERRLLGWTPAPATAGRERMLFEAGVAAGRRRALIQVASLATVLILGAGGWIAGERAARTRLEVALAEQTRALEVARADRPMSPQPDPGLPAAPASLVALDRRRDLDLIGSVAPRAGGDQFPGPFGAVLTPASARRVDDLFGL